MGKKIGLVLAAGILLIGCLGGCFLLGSHGSSYYTQIDNSQLVQNGPRTGVVDLSGGMAYTYTLTTYDEGGQEKTIDFGASRKLREGAFICLEVLPLRGVISWEEVSYSDLPTAVQAHYLNAGQN